MDKEPEEDYQEVKEQEETNDVVSNQSEITTEIKEETIIKNEFVEPCFPPTIKEMIEMLEQKDFTNKSSIDDMICVDKVSRTPEDDKHIKEAYEAGLFGEELVDDTILDPAAAAIMLGKSLKKKRQKIKPLMLPRKNEKNENTKSGEIIIKTELISNK